MSILFSVGIGGIFTYFHPVTPQQVHEFIHSLGPWGPVGLVGAIAVLIVLVPAPTIPFDIAAGVGYGVWMGSALVLAGHLIGAGVAFLLARRFGRSLLARLLRGRTAAGIGAIVDDLELRLLVLMRLLPLFDFKVVSYASGLTAMSFGQYIMGTAAGIILPILGMVAVGSELVGEPIRATLILAGFGLAAGSGAAFFCLVYHPKERTEVTVPPAVVGAAHG